MSETAGTTPVQVTSGRYETLDSGDERSDARLRPVSPVPTYVGVGLCVLGFVLLAISWGKVAGETEVWRQLPYLVSGGFTGLGLLLVGVTVVNIAAKRADAADRERQAAQLADALRELRAGLEQGRR